MITTCVGTCECMSTICHLETIPAIFIFIKTKRKAGGSQTFELKKHTLVRTRVFHQLVQENEHLNLEKDFEIVFF